MKCIDRLHPGLKKILKKNFTLMLIQAQDHYAFRTTIDQRGKQILSFCS